jgi:signal transduction histidine kinase
MQFLTGPQYSDEKGADQAEQLNSIEQANTLLEKVDGLFSEAENIGASLGRLAQLTVPQLADWCAVYLQNADGEISRAAVAPSDAINAPASYVWFENDLLNNDAEGIPAVIHDGEAKLVSDVTSYQHASDAGIKSFMVIPLINARQTLGVVILVIAHSARRFDQNSLALAQNLAMHIANYLDKLQLYQESQKLNAELEQRVSERTAELRLVNAQLKQSEEMLQTLFRISNKLNATLDLDIILDELAQEAIQMVNGESGFAGLRTAEGMTVHKYFKQGAAVPFEFTWPIGQGVPGWVLKYKVPYGTSDAPNDPLILHDLAINNDVKTIICTPILDTVGEVIAYFDIRNKQDEEGFTINDQEMLLTLAPVASIAIQNALAYQQRLATVAELKDSTNQLHELAASLESAMEEERTRIARELHDQLGQALTAMKYDLAWLADQLKQGDAPLAQKARDIAVQLNTTIKTVRRIATELRPGMLDDLGLAASIEWQAYDVAKRAGLDCEVSLPTEDIHLSHDQSLALFRILQEALSNVALHAYAKHINVALGLTDQQLSLEIQDDGRGIRAEEVTALRSLGVLGMRERAKHLGWTFNIQGEPGKGTIVKVSVPINQTKS